MYSNKSSIGRKMIAKLALEKGQRKLYTVYNMPHHDLCIFPRKVRH